VVSGFCDGGLNILFSRASQAAGSAFVYLFNLSLILTRSSSRGYTY
jgi:hypothetical protein